jgi:conserved oligomeric Golgi complex subunit 5
LRLKIRVPYQSLDSHVNRLQKLQQASDVLRRISRFVILARRLEVQMAELSKGGDSDIDLIQSPQIIRTISDSLEPENEKERAIAKAALTIAELS